MCAIVMPEHHSESPDIDNSEHRNHATIAASFAQRLARELGTLIINQQQD